MSKKLDYSIESPQERVAFVEELLKNTSSSQLTNHYKEILSNYIIFSADKQERKEKKILTESRMVTVNKRETSYEGLISKLENGEDGLYNLMHEDKNTLLSPKKPITADDIAEIPHLQTLVEEIFQVEAAAKQAIGTGKRAYLLRKQVIQMRQDQYVIRNGAKQPAQTSGVIKILARMDLDENISIDEFGGIHSTGLVSLLNPDHVSALLCHYSALKQEVWENLELDMHYLLIDLDSLVERSLLINHAMLYDLLVYKIDGKTNAEIQRKIESDYGIKHSPEYISSLWRNKIPKLIAEEAQREWLLYHFIFEEKGSWKKCSRCGRIKLAHNKFFSKNKTSKDGFYSICKDCRNNKDAAGGSQARRP